MKSYLLDEDYELDINTGLNDLTLVAGFANGGNNNIRELSLNDLGPYRFYKSSLVNIGGQRMIILSVATYKFRENIVWLIPLFFALLIPLVTVLYAYRLHLTRKDKIMIRMAEERARGKFLTYMYHELRNPLHALLNLTQDLIDEQETSDTAESIALIQSIVDHMCNLLGSFIIDDRSKRSAAQNLNQTSSQDLNSYLESSLKMNASKKNSNQLRRSLSRLSIRKSQEQLLHSGAVLPMLISPEPVDIEALVEETFAQYRVMRAEAVELKLYISPFVKGLVGNYDPVRLRQILSNGLSNANKYTNSGTIELRCELLPSDIYDNGEQLLVFTITDTGTGLDPSLASGEIFQASKYGLSKPSINAKANSLPSSGLGLGVCKTLVEQMRGNISITNRTDGINGAVFKVSIPFIPSDSTAVKNNTPRAHHIMLRGDYHFSPEAKDYPTRHPFHIDSAIEEHCIPMTQSILSELLPSANECPNNQVFSGSDLPRTEASLQGSSPSPNITSPSPNLTSPIVKSEKYSTPALSQSSVITQNEIEFANGSTPNASASKVSSKLERTASSTPQIEKQSNGIANARILACEDDPVNVALLRRILSKKLSIPTENFVILDDGDEVEAYLESEAGKKFNPNILLLDIVMKRMHGDVVCEQLRKNGYTFPIVATTGTCMESDRRRFLDIGFNLIVPKPYTSEDIMNAANKCLVIQ